MRIGNVNGGSPGGAKVRDNRRDRVIIREVGFGVDRAIVGGDFGHRGRKVRTPQDSRLANGQAGQPDGIVQQRTDSPNGFLFAGDRDEKCVGDGETVR
jgi:hypothetical protein